MDFPELAKILFRRIQILEPEDVSKITGCILLNEASDQELVKLAYASETELLLKIRDAKVMLEKLCLKNSTSSSLQYHGASAFSPPRSSFHNSHSWISPVTTAAAAAAAEHQHLRSHGMDFARLRNASFVEEYSPNKPYYTDSPLSNCTGLGVGMGLRNSRKSQSFSELPIKTCHYFNKGYCKHGMNCSYYHAQSFSDGQASFASGMDDFELEKLDMEITELLRLKRGTPVSIATLPMLYYDKYGKHLQAEGYLTESQRHGKVGLSLTKLLHRLKSVRVIERPHGQHAVILAEDAARYPECRKERIDANSASSHQIYLTFPADSTFTEEDVSNYYKQYGQVRDVRIPCQERRMFGFVSFFHPETVDAILMRGNPHYICGARVLVKPYRERSRNTDRTNTEKLKSQTYYSTLFEVDPDIYEVTQQHDSSMALREQLMRDQGPMAEFERMRLPEPSLEPKFSDDPFKFGLDHFSYVLDSLNNGAASEDKVRQINDTYDDHDSFELELPESPFSPSVIGSSISAVM